MSLNYVMMGSNDVAKARPYYDAVLPLIGGRIFADFMPHAFCYEFRKGGRNWVAPYLGQSIAAARDWALALNLVRPRVI